MLSGRADKDIVLKTLGVAHQFFRKPCPPGKLFEAIARSVCFRNVVKSDYLKGLIAGMKSLPVLPPVFSIIQEELQNENASLKKIAFIISKDVSVTATILRLVNSSFFGQQRTVSDVYQALSLLGVDTIKSIVLCAHLFRTLKPRQFNGFSVKLLWEHCARVSCYAKALGELEGFDRKTCDALFVAGMLHDIGKLVLATGMPLGYEKVINMMKTNKHSRIFDAEMEVFFATHSDVGAYLLNIWGIENDVVELVRLHHE